MTKSLSMEESVRKSTSRRNCLKIMAAAAGGAATGAGSAKLVGRLGAGAAGPWRVLTEREAELVGAVCAQIIPPDQDPGARETGAVEFIDRQLDGPYAHHAETYRKGLRCLEQTSLALFDKPFGALPWSDQTRLLQALESGKTPGGIWKDPSARNFFSLIRDHTMQSFYGSPRHGGNRNYASYRMLGIEYPRIIGRNRHGA